MGAFLVLVVGLVAGLILVKQQQDIRSKAYTSPSGSACGLVNVVVSEQSCPSATYSTTYTLSSLDGKVHSVYYLKRTDYCLEPQGEPKPGGGVWCTQGNQDSYQTVTVPASGSVVVTISRSSTSGQACGSFQLDLEIQTIDGQSCKASFWGFCPTGATCPQTVACNETCDATHLCPANLTCDATSKKCRKASCLTETTCTCPTPTAVCQKVVADKDLSTVQNGDTVTFTGYGTLGVGDNTDSIDKIKFTIFKDGIQMVATDSAALLDPTQTTPTVQVYKATYSYQILAGGSYQVVIKVHRVKGDVWLE